MRIPDIGSGASKANGATGLGRHPGSQAGVLRNFEHIHFLFVENAVGTGTF
jgi:hypothetical protein